MKKKMVIACLKCEAASWPLFIREPTDCGLYLKEGLRWFEGKMKQSLKCFSFTTLFSAYLSRLDFSKFESNIVYNLLYDLKSRQE